MNYTQQHLRGWFVAHDALNLNRIEELSEIPKGTLRHFLKERRELPKSHLDNVIKVLFDYSYREL